MRTYKMKALLMTALLALNGCGGGGSSTPSEGTNPPPPTTPTKIYSVCVTKELSPQYTCMETCSDSTIEISTHNELNTCTLAGDKWLLEFNHSDTPSTNDQKNGLTWINTIRKGVGLPEFNYNSKLELATIVHEKYLGDTADTYNVNQSHYEDNNSYPSEFYRGVQGTDRARSAGYTGYYAGDVISYQTGATSVSSLDDLMSAIYHRQALLWNFTNEIGIGNSNHSFNFKSQAHLMGAKSDRDTTLRAASAKAVYYPYDGQTEVRRVFHEESPDPLPNTSLSGYPISIDFNSYYVNSVEISYFKLYIDGGAEITNVVLMDKVTDPNGKFSEYQFALFPLDVLASNITYRVEVGYILNGESGNNVWTFTTR